MRRNADTQKVDAPGAIDAPHRRRWILEPEMLVGFGALLVGLCALFVGGYGAYLQRSHDRASVWPHVQYGAFYTPHGVVLELTNTGIGPALIQSVGVFLNGRPMTGWPDVFQHLAGGVPPHDQSGVRDNAIRAGDSVQMVTIPATILALMNARSSDRLGNMRVDICYASIYGERW